MESLQVGAIPWGTVLSGENARGHAGKMLVSGEPEGGFIKEGVEGVTRSRRRRSSRGAARVPR